MRLDYRQLGGELARVPAPQSADVVGPPAVAAWLVRFLVQLRTSAKR